MEENTLPGLFQRWKIALIIAIALSISAITLVTSFSQRSFQLAPKCSGTHQWIDSNHNGKVDLQLTTEFIPAKEGQYRQIGAIELIGQMHWSLPTLGWLLLAVVAMIGRDFGYMIRIRLLTKRAVTWKQSLHIILLWEFASALAPGVMSGATVAMFILKKEGIALGKATAIVLLTAFFDNLFYLIFIPVVFIFLAAPQLFPSGQAAQTVQTIFWTGYGVFFSLTTILYLSIFRFPSLVSTLLGAITKLRPFRKWHDNALKTGQDVANTAMLMKAEPIRFWLKTFAATCLSWTSRFLVINAVLQAFIQLGMHQHLQLFSKQFVLWMFLRVSPTPGGSGVAEWAFAELLGGFTANLAMVGTMAVIWRCISYFPYLLIGSILLPKWLRKKQPN
jgi:uncharacterized protein (TIRG00374 family)